MTQPNAERRPPRPGDGVRKDARPRTASIAPPDPAGGPAYIVARHLAGGRVHRRVFLTADAAERLRARLAGEGVPVSVQVAYLTPTPPEAPEAAQGAPEAPEAARAAPEAADLFPGQRTLTARSVALAYWTTPEPTEEAGVMLSAISYHDVSTAAWVAAGSRDPRALALALACFGGLAINDAVIRECQTQPERIAPAARFEAVFDQIRSELAQRLDEANRQQWAEYWKAARP